MNITDGFNINDIDNIDDSINNALGAIVGHIDKLKDYADEAYKDKVTAVVYELLAELTPTVGRDYIAEVSISDNNVKVKMSAFTDIGAKFIKDIKSSLTKQLVASNKE